MGILRTDKISGLETPTPVTGSVVFDGTGDYLDLTLPAFGNSDFTFELWFWADTFNAWNTIFEYGNHTASSDGIIVSLKGSGVFARNGSTDISNATITVPYQIPQGAWNHLALTREGTTARLHINGVFVGSATWSKVFTETNLRIASARYLSGESYTDYISNFRVLKGTALYNESNFTPPVHALEVIKDTIILCCNNPNSAGAEATGKTITVNGNAAASTFSPGLTRDFTFGTEFRGVTTFDTQGYFVPPSGTTEQRGAGNAIFAGGYIGPAATNVIEYMNLNSSGSQRDFGDLKGGAYAPSVTSSSTRALIAGGYISPAVITNIDYVTLSSSGMNALDFGDLTIQRRDFSGCSNNTRSIFGGGTTTGSTSITTSMEYMTSASLGSVASFGDLLSTGRGNASCSSPTRGIFFGGYQAFTTPVSTYTNAINYITIATTGTTTDFGDLVIDNNGKKGGHAAFSNSTRGVVGGGAAYFSPAYTVYNTIEYITIATTGNAQDFGDLIQGRNYLSGTSNSVRGFFTQGTLSPDVNTCEFVTISSTGNAQDFGDFVNVSYTYNNAGSDSHGGIS